MPSLLRSAVVRVGTLFVYCSGAVIAPTIHHAFHRDNHVHVGDSIVYPHTEREAAEEHNREEHARAQSDLELQPHEHLFGSEDPLQNAEHEELAPSDHLSHVDGSSTRLAEVVESGRTAASHPPAQQHDRHDDQGHGATSLWHFGAALSDHLDRTPALPTVQLFVWLRPTNEASVPPLLARETLRLRGPPQRVAA